MSRVNLTIALILFTAAFATSQTTVTGRITGQDGKPMIDANVVLLAPADVQDTVQTARAEKNGDFSITVDSTGVWFLEFTGVGHEYKRVAFYFDEPGTIHVDVRLETYKYLDTFNGVKVVGNFNGWDDASALPMVKRPDSTYSLVVKTTADSVAYRLMNVAKGDLVEGTDADYYLYDGYWGYNSILTPKNGEVSIVFDPSKLERSDKPSAVAFADSSSTEAKFAAIFEEMQNNEKAFMDYYRSYIASGKNMMEFHYDWSAAERSIAARIAAEKNPLLKKELMFAYFELGALTAKLDTPLVREGVGIISPKSHLWALMPIVSTVLRLAGESGAQQDAYIQKVADDNPSADVKAAVLANEFMLAKQTGDAAATAKYYNLIVERCGNTRVGKEIEARFSPGAGPEAGREVPAFSVVSMDDSTETISNVSMKGTYYLMDFWATWCGPCVAEMPNLQKAYDTFKGDDFTILSLSLDRTKEDVVKFRNSKWKMPWLNVFLGADSQDEILRDFDVMAIPNPVLVDSTGKILATGVQLRGDQLMKTLEKYLKK